MTALTLRRYFTFSAGLLGLLMASCSSTKKKTGYEDVVDYTSPSTGLSQEEYPFDENGNYLADVVSGKKKGKAGKPAETPKKSYVETYEKPVITSADTPPPPAEIKPPASSNPIYERVPEPDSTHPSYSSGGGTSYSSSSSSGSSRPKPTAGSSSSSQPKPKPKPKTATASTSKPKPKPKPKAPSTITYTVKNGDTLYSLANRYGTSVSAIKKASGLSSDLLRDGRTLRIPRN